MHLRQGVRPVRNPLLPRKLPSSALAAARSKEPVQSELLQTRNDSVSLHNRMQAITATPRRGGQMQPKPQRARNDKSHPKIKPLLFPNNPPKYPLRQSVRSCTPWQDLLQQLNCGSSQNHNQSAQYLLPVDGLFRRLEDPEMINQYAARCRADQKNDDRHSGSNNS